MCSAMRRPTDRAPGPRPAAEPRALPRSAQPAKRGDPLPALQGEPARLDASTGQRGRQDLPGVSGALWVVPADAAQEARPAQLPDLPPVDEAAALSPEDAEELRRTAESHDNVVVSEEESEEESEDEDEPDPRAQLERAIAQLTAETRPPRRRRRAGGEPPPPPRGGYPGEPGQPAAAGRARLRRPRHSTDRRPATNSSRYRWHPNRALFLANASRGISGSKILGHSQLEDQPPWRVGRKRRGVGVCGAWCVVRGAWCVVRSVLLITFYAWTPVFVHKQQRTQDPLHTHDVRPRAAHALPTAIGKPNRRRGDGQCGRVRLPMRRS